MVQSILRRVATAAPPAINAAIPRPSRIPLFAPVFAREDLGFFGFLGCSEGVEGGVDSVGAGGTEVVVEGLGSGVVVDGVGFGAGVVVDGVGFGAGVVVDGVGFGAGVVVDGVGDGAGVVVDGVGSGVGVVVDGVGVGFGLVTLVTVAV